MLKILEMSCENTGNLLAINEKKPRFSWILESEKKDILQSSYQMQLALDKEFNSIYMDSGVQKSSQSVLVPYEGEALLPSTAYYCRVKVEDDQGESSPWSPVLCFETALLDSPWKATFISPRGEKNARKSPGWFLEKEITLEKNIEQVRVYATALGLYSLNINGSPAGDHVLAPGWTNYDKRLLYQSYDVTEFIQEGNNLLSVHIGPGWYKGDLMGGRNFFGRRIGMSMQVLIRYEDGEEQWILSDESWKSRPSPVLSSEIYHGEKYDARREGPSRTRLLSKAGVDILPQDSSVITAQDGPLIKRQESLPVVEFIKTPRGDTVLDFGQNLTGWVRFHVRGKAGDSVILKHAEILDQKGNFYTKNLRKAKQKIHYILKGGTEEIYEPCFTFQGFRYVKVESWPGDVRADDFEAIVVHSEMEDRGNFSCSSALVNQLHHNIVWGMKGNFLDVPTDCPQRNERLGWTGDAQAFIGTASYLKSTHNFFRKWLRDLASEQHDDGGIPHVIPDVLSRKGRGKIRDPFNPFHSSAGWSDAAVICPWESYLSFGDTEVLRENYECMALWVSYISAHADDGLIWRKGFQYGDWLALDRKNEKSSFGGTPNDFTATAFYANSVHILAESAALLGKEDDTIKYKALHKDILKAFRARFVTDSGHLTVQTQTAQVLALQFNLVPENLRGQICDDLVKLIQSAGNQLSTGFLGTPYLNRVLVQEGRWDVAEMLLLREDYPSWLYPVKQGATTIWERWDGIKPNGDFQSTGMNSFNHYAYGAVGQYLYESLAGITPLEAGFKSFQIKPHPGKMLNSVNAQFKSPYGMIAVQWVYEDGEMELSLTIPPNTTALVFLPEAPGCFQEEPLKLGSGEYEWKYKFEGQDND